jgi:rubredoxin
VPWRCPACSTRIHHNPHEASPRDGVVYRCSVCRLELIVDPKRGDRMIVVPVSPAPPTRDPKRR